MTNVIQRTRINGFAIAVVFTAADVILKAKCNLPEITLTYTLRPDSGTSSRSCSLGFHTGFSRPYRVYVLCVLAM